jgi:hypothetical protein
MKIDLLDVATLRLEQLLLGFVGRVADHSRSLGSGFSSSRCDVGEHRLGLVVELVDLGVDRLIMFGHAGFVFGGDEMYAARAIAAAIAALFSLSSAFTSFTSAVVF